MSNTIDQKVVEMQFDNRNFERNVQTSMNTLNRLQTQLNMTGAAKGLENINYQANNMKFSGLSNAIDNIGYKFSSLEIIAFGFLSRLGQKAADAGTRLVKSLSVDNITAGWDKLQQKANSVSTLLSQGYDMDVVEKQMNKLNWFSDETSYNFTDMIDNISKFTATGKGLEDSTTAMQGIALWAAKSGQNAQKASAAMYQLSQALGAGYMRKEDYKSIQNYSMDTDEFRQVALDTAVALKKVKKVGTDTYKSLTGDKKKFTKSQFAESLTTGQWFDSEVMMEVYSKYAKGSDQMNEIINKMSEDYNKNFIASDLIEAYDAYKGEKFDSYLESNGIKGEAAETLTKMISELDDFGVSAFRAGQEYRTFNDVIDATKDAVSTKWMGIFETILGNVEQQKEIWSTIGDKFYKWFAEPLNAVQSELTDWAKQGGRDDLFAAFGNIAKFIGDIIAPIKKAFGEIFSSIDSKKILAFTKGLKDLTSKLTVSDKTAQAIKMTFKGLFAILSIIISVVKTVVIILAKVLQFLSPIGSIILKITGFLGELAVKLQESIKNSELFTKIISGLSAALKFLSDKISKAIDKIKEFFKASKSKVDSSPIAKAGDAFESVKKKVSPLIEFFKELYSKIAPKVKLVFSTIGKAVKEAFQSGDFNKLSSLLNAGLFASLLMTIKKTVKQMKPTISTVIKLFEVPGQITQGITNVLNTVQGCFVEYQKSIKADVIKKIAIAIAILAASILVLSLIKPEKLAAAVMALSALFWELSVSFKTISESASGMKMKDSAAAVMMMYSLSISMLILSAALKKLDGMKPESMLAGVIAMALLMKLLVSTANTLSKIEGNSTKGIGQLLAMSISVLILAKACSELGQMKLTDLAKGVGGVVVLIGALTIVAKILSKNTGEIVGSGIALIAMAAAVAILARVCKMFNSIEWGDMAKAGVFAAGLLVFVAVMGAIGKMGPELLLGAASLVLMTGSLVILAGVCKLFSIIKWEDLAKAGVFGLGLLAFAAIMGAIGLMGPAVLAGAASLLLMAEAIVLIVPPLMLLSTLSLGSIGIALLAIAGVFVVLGAAAFILAPLAPIILALAGAFTLLGIGVLGIGAGLMLAATGIATLIAVGTAGAAAFIAAMGVIISGFIALIPKIAEAIGKTIVAICGAITTSAAAIGKAVVSLIYTTISAINQTAGAIIDCIMNLIILLLGKLIEYGPQIGTALYDLIISGLNVLSQKLPELIQAGVELMISFINGLADGIRNNVDAMKDAMTNLCEAILDAICTFFGIESPSKVFADIGKYLIEGLINGITNMIGSAVKIVKDLASKLVSGIGEKASSFLTKGKELMTKLKDGIANKISSVKSKAKEVVTKAKEAIEEKIDEFKTVGKNIVEGLKKGIEEAKDKVVGAATGVASGLVSGVKSFLGINSPSKVFYSIGEFTGQGLINGLNDSEHSIYEASSSLGKSAKNGLNKSLDGISDLLDGSMDNQPVIKPVLDLSDIRSGVGTMGGLFGNVGVGANLNAISSGTNSRLQNGRNADIISALDKLGQGLENNSGDTYNINGITYGDDGAINDAVRTLVRAANIERRI